MNKLELIPIQHLPEIKPGDHLPSLFCDAIAAQGETIKANDILIVAQKIISKSEKRYVHLSTVTPSDNAKFLANICEKDPRLVELILRESKRVVRVRAGLIIVEHRLGFVHANAGIDRSNLGIQENDALSQDEWVLLLPENPQASAEQLSQALSDQIFDSAYAVPVIINDSMGRAWRNGTVGMAIAAAQLAAIDDHNGRLDRAGRELQATQIAVADEMAAAASLLMGQADEGCPVVILRGWQQGDRHRNMGVDALLREPAQDLFR